MGNPPAKCTHYMTLYASIDNESVIDREVIKEVTEGDYFRQTGLPNIHRSIIISN